MQRIERLCDELVQWLKIKVAGSNSKGVIFGLSGGVDSAVIAGLAKKAFPETSLGVIMPCHSDPIDEEHGLLVAEALDLETKKVDLTVTYDSLIDAVELEGENILAKANIKPRLRMTTLYYIGQEKSYLVLGGTNKSEFTVGYFTKHGDSGVDLLPLASFVKQEIWEMARYLNIPDSVVDKAPTAGLWEDQTDEEEMGFGYEELDNFILDGSGDRDLVEKIERMDKISEHKRNYPPIFLGKD